MERRDFIHQALVGLAGTVTAAAVSKQALASLPDPIYQPSAGTAPPWRGPETEGPEARYRPVVTLNGWTLPYRMNEGVKEFHLVAEPVVREMSPGFKVNMWGYNGQSPGPTAGRNPSRCALEQSARPGEARPSLCGRGAAPAQKAGHGDTEVAETRKKHW